MASESNTGETILYLGIAAGAAWVIYQVVQAVKAAPGTIAAAGSAAVDAVSNPIAAAITQATLPAAMVPTGSILLPSGATIPAASVLLQFDELSNAAYFTYQGHQYLITQGTPSGQGMVAELVN